MNLGFTGTQRGMTPAQYDAVWALLHVRVPGDFHEGDCIGADMQAAHLARHAGFRIVCHPPTNSSKRAFFPADEMRPALPYLDRNKQIVLASEEMIATPGEFDEQLRSGTWSTVRFARKQGKRCLVVLPDGRLL